MITDLIRYAINMIKRDKDYNNTYEYLIWFLENIDPYRIIEFKSLEEIERFNKNSKNKIQYNKKELQENVKDENKGFITKEIKFAGMRSRQVWSKKNIKKILRFDNARDKIVYPCYTDIKEPSTLVFLVKIIN
jgi:hypothetical protein